VGLWIDYLESSREIPYNSTLAKGKKRDISNIDSSPLAIARSKNKGKGRAIENRNSIEDTIDKERIDYSSNIEETILESRLLEERANRERLLREDIGEGPSNIEGDTSNIEKDTKRDESSSTLKRVKHNKIKVYKQKGRPKKVKSISKGRPRKV